MFQPILKSKSSEDISILLKMDNHPWNYLCECGESSELTVKEIQNTNAVFISHTHIDHFVNFDAVIRHQLGIQRRVVICGPEGLAQRVHARINSYTWNLIEAGAVQYEVRELVAQHQVNAYELLPPAWELRKINSWNTNVLFEHKDFKVTGVLLDHKVPTLAYLFTQHDAVKIQLEGSGLRGGPWVQLLKSAFERNDGDTLLEIEGQRYRTGELFQYLFVQKGDTVGVIMDHAAHSENHALIQHHFKNTRRVYIESYYKESDKALAKMHAHSYSSRSAKVMRAAQVLEPIPVHFSRKYEEAELQLLQEEFRQGLL